MKSDLRKKMRLRRNRFRKLKRLSRLRRRKKYWLRMRLERESWLSTVDDDFQKPIREYKRVRMRPKNMSQFKNHSANIFKRTYPTKVNSLLNFTRICSKNLLIG